MSTATVIVIVLAVLAVAAAAWVIMQREKTRKLKNAFGPEYDRAIDQEKNPRRAEALLEERQKRVAKYDIRPLTKEEREAFAAKWRKSHKKVDWSSHQRSCVDERNPFASLWVLFPGYRQTMQSN